MKLPRSLRMTRAGEFRKVREHGRSAVGPHLVVATLEADPEDVSSVRLGFITSRRVGGAVERNAVRRKLRAIAREAGADLTPHRLIVTVARARAAGASFPALRSEWRRLARRLGVLPRS